jgi:hypothetical protein
LSPAVDTATPSVTLNEESVGNKTAELPSWTTLRYPEFRRPPHPAFSQYLSCLTGLSGGWMCLCMEKRRGGKSVSEWRGIEVYLSCKHEKGNTWRCGKKICKCVQFVAYGKFVCVWYNGTTDISLQFPFLSFHPVCFFFISVFVETSLSCCVSQLCTSCTICTLQFSYSDNLYR